jgi:tripeptide aminopeptidase
MFDENYRFTCVERFLRYVKYDTQSDDNATSFPSTEKQKVLLKDLAAELKKVGLNDAHMDEWGYVIGTLPANTEKSIPTIAFLGHADTSPQVSGENVNPMIRKNYRGGDIPLENGLAIKESENQPLKDMVGFDIITTDGRTLLGADDKAGIAEIVDALHYLITHPEAKHGAIEVCITPDEETGRGTEKLDVKKLKAKYAYTVDGSTRGEIETETFSADAAVIKFHGKNIHPGYAKNKLINSVKIAAAFLDSLPKGTLSPETTEGREGYVHCVSLNGTEELTTVKFIVRDFRAEKLKEYEGLLQKLAAEAVSKFPGSRMDFEVSEQYRNMKEVLDKHPKVTAYAVEAMKSLGIKTKEHYIRGGTDGAKLCFAGIPTPNVFAGSQSYHSPLEFVAIQDMEMAVRMIVGIAQVWEEKS